MKLWHKKLHDLIRIANQKGLKVEFCTDKYSKDYLGMNPEAAGVMGFPSKKNTIYIDKHLSQEDKYHVLKHEIYEYDRMKNGASYYKAHVAALENE